MEGQFVQLFANVGQYDQEKSMCTLQVCIQSALEEFWQL